MQPMKHRTALSIVALLLAALVVEACAASAPKADYAATEAEYSYAPRRDAPAEADDASAGSVAQQEVRSESVEAPAPQAPPAVQPPPPVVAAPTLPLQGQLLADQAQPPAKQLAKEVPPSDQLPPDTGATGTEDYGAWGINAFQDPRQDPLSTFSIDVDTASYTISRRKLQEGTLPPAQAVRVEEFVNYFSYNYPEPKSGLPFGVDFAAAPSPFAKDHLFLRVGVQGQRVREDQRGPVHLTFLVDTSGSMHSADKLGLVKKSLHRLVDNLREGDTVSLATYAGSVSRVLDPTGMKERSTIHAAIERLSAGGSTAMESGLDLAYKMAYEGLQPGHVSRVIVCSDGDANVGRSSHEEILKQIRHYTQEGVTLSTIGFGMGNYKDVMMEQLANQGNGNYYYIDSEDQAKKVFEDDLMGTLLVIAKDVKIQVEFDPQAVLGYRLVGYENRDIADKDFRNDAVDAGEIGAGHNVTAIYEVQLKPGARVTPVTVRLRHKAPDGARATENTFRFTPEQLAASFEQAPANFRLAVSVAAFAEVLRRSPFARGWSLPQILTLARESADDSKEQQELIALIETALRLSDSPQAAR